MLKSTFNAWLVEFFVLTALVKLCFKDLLRCFECWGRCWRVLREGCFVRFSRSSSRSCRRWCWSSCWRNCRCCCYGCRRRSRWRACCYCCCCLRRQHRCWSCCFCRFSCFCCDAQIVVLTISFLWKQEPVRTGLNVQFVQNFWIFENNFLTNVRVTLQFDRSVERIRNGKL